MMIKSAGAAGEGLAAIGWTGFLGNLAPVILGNVVGGSVFVGLIYHIIYRRKGS